MRIQGEATLVIGTDYPAHEVNYEQSIVGLAANFLLDLHLVTGEAKWLEAARTHVALLELFEGHQPDHHLNGIAIRHWDGYWFGKYRTWGDTFPHYWSTISVVVYARLHQATGEPGWKEHAVTTLRGNLSQFFPDGNASCGYLYPRRSEGRPAALFDPNAND